MKKFSIVLVAAITLSSCNKEIKKIDRNITIGDTIKTESGLQYIFLKEGNGLKIKEGSKVSVYTDLYLNKDKKVFWTTSTAKDSSFTFILGDPRLIKGFSELHKYLYEGDEVAAILPYTIAYGETGRRGIPAKSTLYYNPLVIKTVSKPKEELKDTLVALVKQKSANDAVSFYENASDADFHKDLNLMGNFLQTLNRDSLFVDLEILSTFFYKKASKTEEKQEFSYYNILALEGQGKIKEAIKIIEPLTKQEVNQAYWKNYLSGLRAKLK